MKNRSYRALRQAQDELPPFGWQSRYQGVPTVSRLRLTRTGIVQPKVFPGLIEAVFTRRPELVEGLPCSAAAALQKAALRQAQGDGFEFDSMNIEEYSKVIRV